MKPVIAKTLLACVGVAMLVSLPPATLPQEGPRLNKLIELTRDYLSETKDRLQQAKESDDVYDYLGSLGAMKVTEARLEWLHNVRKRLLKS